MYITFPAPPKSELWVSDIDGGNRTKIATGENLGTGTWAPDNFHLSFTESGAGAGDKAYIVGADGSSFRQLPPIKGIRILNTVWSSDQKSMYVSGREKAEPFYNTWKWDVDGRHWKSLWTNAACFRMPTPVGSTCLARYYLERRLESTRSPSPTRSASHCSPA